MHRTLNTYSIVTVMIILVVALIWPSRTALADTISVTEPIVGEPTQNPCTGETVILNGNFHLEMSSTADSSGGIHYSIKRMDSLKGVALVTNANYVANDTDIYEFNTSAGTEQTFIYNSLLIRQGTDLRDDDFYFRQRVHVTVNANGVPTADFERISNECR